MRILAIETSGRDASLAALEGSSHGAARLLHELTTTAGERTAQALAPRLTELLREVDWPARSIELVAVALGPGSFTGLRIGVTTAKTFAYATGAELIGVNTLSAIAEQAPSTARPVAVVMDAQRQEFFAATIDGQGAMSDTRIVSQSDWIVSLRPGDLVTGPGLRRLKLELPTEVEMVEESHWRPMAAAVGTIGWRAYLAGQRDDLWKLVPWYYRQSAAEEKTKRQGDQATRG